MGAAQPYSSLPCGASLTVSDQPLPQCAPTVYTIPLFIILLVVSTLLPGEILEAALAVESRELAVTVHAIIALVVLEIIDHLLTTCELFGTIFAQVDRCVHVGPDLLHSLSVRLQCQCLPTL